MQLPTSTLLALLPFFLQQVDAQASGTGTTTRYWDCCKPSCAWPGKASLLAGSNPVTTCDISNNPLTDYNTASGCDGGGAYQCSTESPWAVSEDLSYGYAAVNIAGGTEASWCCACYELTFTSGSIAGKKMIVQATNTGSDLGSNQFDISIPGGGVGIFNGCTAEWGAPSSGWGAQYGGISSATDCSTFPAALQDGCNWRFNWFEGSNNPTVSFKQVACPAAITANSGCTRADDASMPAPAVDTGSALASSSVVVATSSAEGIVASSSTVAAAAVETSFTEPAVAAVQTSSTEPIVAIETSSAEAAVTSSAEGVVTSMPLQTITSIVSVTSKKPSTKLTVAPAKNSNEAEDDACEL